MQFQHTLKHTLKSSLVSHQLSDCSHLDSSFCSFSWSTRCFIKNEPLKWKTGISKQYFLYHPLFSFKVMSTFSRENWKKERKKVKLTVLLLWSGRTLPLAKVKWVKQCRFLSVIIGCYFLDIEKRGGGGGGVQFRNSKVSENSIVTGIPPRFNNAAGLLAKKHTPKPHWFLQA